MAAKSTYNLIFLLILVIAIALISGSFSGLKFSTGADEGYYFKYATYIAEKGPVGFKDLFRDYLENKGHWVYPNPLRVGFIALSSVWLKVFGYSFINLAYLSLLFFILFLYTSYYFSKKYLGGSFALFFSTLLAFSPLSLAMARRALMDSAANFFVALSVWLFWDYLKSRNKIKLILFTLVFSSAILIKESSALLIVIFPGFMILSRAFQKSKVGAVDILTIFVVPVALAFLVYLGIGCISYLPDIARIILNSPKTNPYAIMYGSGPWFRYLVDYMLLSPWVVILSIGFLIHFFVREDKDPLASYFIYIFCFSFILFNLFTKNVRYVMLLDMPMRLFSCFMLERLSRRYFPRQALVIACVLVVAIAFCDYLTFYDLFVKNAIYDPASFLLLKAKQFIP